MKKIIVTSGGTSEKIDNVRKITNSSTGALGSIITRHLLLDKDNFIYYVCSKDSIKVESDRVKVIIVDGTVDLKNKVEELLTSEKIDVFIHSMAVSDYTLDYVTTLDRLESSLVTHQKLEVLGGSKISSYENNLVIVLKPTPKIISIIKSLSPETFLVGFKLLDGVTCEELISVASKLRDKNNCDLVVANDLNTIRNGKHIAYIIDKDDKLIEASDKEDIAIKLVRRIGYGK